MFLTSQPEEMLIKADKKHGPSLSFHHFIIPQYIYIYIYIYITSYLYLKQSARYLERLYLVMKKYSSIRL